ncbi:MAG: hypothetical protein WCF90_01600 [Methanomicrobiales archaeon]
MKELGGYRRKDPPCTYPNDYLPHAKGILYAGITTGHQGERAGEKKYFLLKLVAPRPKFASDITYAILEAIQEHGM